MPVQRLKQFFSKPLTEEQINLRAYEIWQKSGQQGTSEENWQVAIGELKREQSPISKLLFAFWRLLTIPFRLLWQLFILPFRLFWYLLPKRIRQMIVLAFTAETSTAALDIVKVIISAFGVLATIFAGVGLLLTYRNSEADRQINSDRLTNESERLVTERFTKAVEQLGSQDIHVRLGGIYSLERIAKDSPKYHWTVMEVLTAYIRNKSPLPQEWKMIDPTERKSLPSVATDVRSALVVIGRREVKNDIEGGRLNLNATNLSRIDLRGADFRRVDFLGADLREATLIEAKLSGANFRVANLNKAYLIRSDLNSVDFGGANLSGADLREAILIETELSLSNLRGAKFLEADLSGSMLIKANLSETDFRGANLKEATLMDVKGITPQEIKKAKNWREGRYLDDFRKELGLSPEKP